MFVHSFRSFLLPIQQHTSQCNKLSKNIFTRRWDHVSAQNSQLGSLSSQQAVFPSQAGPFDNSPADPGSGLRLLLWLISALPSTKGGHVIAGRKSSHCSPNTPHLQNLFLTAQIQENEGSIAKNTEIFFKRNSNSNLVFVPSYVSLLLLCLFVHLSKRKYTENNRIYH